MALYSIYPREDYYKYAYDWADFHKWGMRNGNTTRNADDHCCGQTYIDLYNICPSDPNMIRNIKASIDMVVNTPQVNDWWWIDAVQMAMPIFAKFGKMIYIGHLDIMRYFQKALRRADVDLAYTQGYNPHPILSFAAPLGVGITSCGEYADLEVNSSGSSKEMLARLNEVMVPGMEIIDYRVLPDDAKNAMSCVAAADYLSLIHISEPTRPY